MKIFSADCTTKFHIKKSLRLAWKYFLSVWLLFKSNHKKIPAVSKEKFFVRTIGLKSIFMSFFKSSKVLSVSPDDNDCRRQCKGEIRSGHMERRREYGSKDCRND